MALERSEARKATTLAISSGSSAQRRPQDSMLAIMRGHISDRYGSISLRTSPPHTPLTRMPRSYSSTSR